MSLVCASLALVGMTAPACIGLRDVDMMAIGGSFDKAVSTCNKSDNTLEDCKVLFEVACVAGTEPTVSRIEWRDVRAKSGLIIAPWTYTHVFECAEPGKEIQ